MKVAYCWHYLRRMQSRVYLAVWRLSVSLSVHLSVPSWRTAAGLLLCTQWAGDIDGLQHGWR